MSMDMSPNEMSSNMKKMAHSEKMKNKMFGNFLCSWFINGIMAGIYGWFAFPGGNMDASIVFARNSAERELLDDATYESQFPSDLDKAAFWTQGMCFYTPTTVDGMANKVVQFSADVNNSNQRWVSVEFMGACFILFIASLIVSVASMFQAIAFKTHSNKCF